MFFKVYTSMYIVPYHYRKYKGENIIFSTKIPHEFWLMRGEYVIDYF